MKRKTAFQKNIDAHLLQVMSEGTMVLKLGKAYCHEITTPPDIRKAEKLGIDVVWDPNKVFAMIDHVSPANNQKTALQGYIMRQWSKKHDIPFFEVGENGICHALIPEKFLIGPGENGIMGDSHTCTYGALGALSVGVGTTDLGCGLKTGIFLLRPQKVIRINFFGKLPANVYAKDLALTVVNRFGKGSAKNTVLEFGGNLEKTSMAGRFTISNMVAEAGATCGMWPVDQATINYLWPGLKKDYPCKEDALRDLSKWNSDPDCEYHEVIDIDVSELKPLTTINYHPSETVAVVSRAGEVINQVVIGSCTNGRLEDLRVAAAIIKKIDCKVKVRTIVIPATSHIYQRAVEEGLVSIFLKAGCCVTNPTCGPCLGMSCGVLWEGEMCLATTNRNYDGRMGKGGTVRLCSPAVAAYSAMFGVITEPGIDLCTEINAGVDSADEVVPFTREKKPVQAIDYEKLVQSLASMGTVKEFSGKPFYLERDKVNTDAIIPPEYLNEVDEKAFGEHCLEQVVTDPEERKMLFTSRIIVSGKEFGTGSSREQAPWALEGAGVNCIIAKGFERIFETNFFNNGDLAITLPLEIVDELFQKKPEHIEVIWNTAEGEPGHIRYDDGETHGGKTVEFPITEFQKSIIRNGGSIGVMLKLAAQLQQQGKI